MKAITIRQPWAVLIALGVKKIETRKTDRFHSLKGQRIAIHAGKRWDPEAVKIVKMINPAAALYITKFIYPNRKKFSGKVVCTTRVYDACWLDGRHTQQALCRVDDLFGLFLTDVVKMMNPPIPARGRQGIWTFIPKV